MNIRLATSISIVGRATGMAYAMQVRPRVVLIFPSHGFASVIAEIHVGGRPALHLDPKGTGYPNPYSPLFGNAGPVNV